METLSLGSEWFYCARVSQEDIERVIPKLQSGDRYEYLCAWLSLMMRAVIFVDPARQLEGDELALHLARLCSLMPDSDIERSVHTVLKASRALLQ
jgi:hypothetical protein